MATTTLKVYRTNDNVKLPEFGTEQAACFDICYQPWGKVNYSGYSADNSPFTRNITNNGTIIIMPGDRVLLPTGLIFDIPQGFSIRAHPRSGMSLKRGLTLFNCEGVIDSDYFHETHITLFNMSSIKQEILPGERLIQAELVRIEKYVISETRKIPEQKTDRIGGFGSTDVKNT